MKFVYLLAICVVFLAAMANAQKKFVMPTEKPRNVSYTRKNWVKISNDNLYGKQNF